MASSANSVGQSATIFDGTYFKDRLPILFPISVWLTLFAWRPLFFGFYHDDWSLLLGCHGSIIEELRCVDASRPGAVLIRWMFYQFAGYDPALWQCITIASMLAAALTLMLVVRNVLRAMGFEEPWVRIAAAISSGAYLAFPWMLGVAWVTGTSPNFATSASICRCLRGSRGSRCWPAASLQ